MNLSFPFLARDHCLSIELSEFGPKKIAVLAIVSETEGIFNIGGHQLLFLSLPSPRIAS